MAGRKTYLLRLVVAFALLSFLLFLVACSTDTPQNTFDVKGDVARSQRDIFNYALWPAVAILIVVEGLLVFALFRFRQKRGQPLPPQVHGNTRLEIAWTIAPAILLFVLSVPMIAGIIYVGREPKADALPVRVIGHQWFWEFQYTGPEFSDAEGKPLTVIGVGGAPAELHIPVGREIAVNLESADVIHSFWVPKLGGKRDAIPGRTGTMWLNATQPGTYSGQCAEFCGLGHAGMRLTIIAESEGEFQTWAEGQRAAQAGPGEASLARQGE